VGGTVLAASRARRARARSSEVVGGTVLAARVAGAKSFKIGEGQPKWLKAGSWGAPLPDSPLALTVRRAVPPANLASHPRFGPTGGHLLGGSARARRPRHTPSQVLASRTALGARRRRPSARAAELRRSLQLAGTCAGLPAAGSPGGRQRTAHDRSAGRPMGGLR
jgi:hypothetical protein